MKIKSKTIKGKSVCKGKSRAKCPRVRGCKYASVSKRQFCRKKEAEVSLVKTKNTNINFLY